MAYNVKQFITRAEDIVRWLEGEYGSIRTGRATPTLLDLVLVESYGSRVPLQQVGSLSVEDARTLRITVWDKNGIRSVEKALIDADLGVSVVTDGAGVRVIFPELTSERRAQLIKIAKAKLEEARVSLRGARDEAIKEIDRQHKEGGMSEDERFAAKEDLQKKVDACNASLEKVFDLKETEINS